MYFVNDIPREELFRFLKSIEKANSLLLSEIQCHFIYQSRIAMEMGTQIKATMPRELIGHGWRLEHGLCSLDYLDIQS